jgi:hypothetical protein
MISEHFLHFYDVHLFQLSDVVLEIINTCDLDRVTSLRFLNLLYLLREHRLQTREELVSYFLKHQVLICK